MKDAGVKYPKRIYLGRRVVTPHMLYHPGEGWNQWESFINAYRSTLAGIKRGEDCNLESCYMYYRDIKYRSRRERRSRRRQVRFLPSRNQQRRKYKNIKA